MGDTMFYNEDKTVTNRQLIPEDTVYNIDAVNGTVLRSWGANMLSLPHSLTIGWDGSVWITDCGLHQVFKFSRAGESLLTLGTAYQPGSSNKTFCRPTDVAVMPDGTVLITDGYCNSRLLTLPPGDNGSNGLAVSNVFIDAAKTTPALVLHSVSVDACAGVAYLADRERGGVVVVNLREPAKSSALMKYWAGVATRFDLGVRSAGTCLIFKIPSATALKISHKHSSVL